MKSKDIAFDKKLEIAHKEALQIKPKKETKKMKINKESVKTWIIVLLIATLAGIGLYNFAFNAGYAAKTLDLTKVNAEVNKQLTQLKTNGQ